jgi:hypothetical protein
VQKVNASTGFSAREPRAHDDSRVVEDGPTIVRVIREHHAAWKLAQGMPARKG